MTAITFRTMSAAGRAVLAAVCLSQVAASREAMAQTAADTLAQQVDRHFSREAQEKLRPVPAEGVSVPVPPEPVPVAGGALFFVTTISLKGVQSLPLSLFTPLISRYEGRKVSLGELHRLANEVQRTYLSRGLIAACIIPPQDVRQGVVEMVVVETRMGDLGIGELRYFRTQVLRRYWTTHRGEILHFARIQRSLQLMNLNPDRSVRADLRAGREPGTTDVLLEVKERRPWHVTVSSDMEGSAATGRNQMTYGLRHNNFLGWDDTLLAGYTLSHHADGKYIYHRIPLNGSGTSLMYGYSYSKSQPKKAYTPLEMDSLSRTSSVFLYQNLFQTDRGSAEVSLGFEAKDSRTRMLRATTTRDRLRVVRAGGTFYGRGARQDLMFNPTLSQGVNAPGARSRDGLTSRDTDNVFSSLEADLSHRWAIGGDWSLVNRVGAQLASRRLPSGEAYSLGGMNSVRGYPDGDRLADDAIRTNTELLFPLPFIPGRTTIPWSGGQSLRGALSGLVFLDEAHGRQRVDKDTPGRMSNLASAGAGLRVQVPGAFALRTEWGFPFGDDPEGGARGSRFHFSCDIDF